MENNLNQPEHTPDKEEEKVPDVAIAEKDDAPAGKNIKRTIIIAVVLLVIFYLIYHFVGNK